MRRAGGECAAREIEDTPDCGDVAGQYFPGVAKATGKVNMLPDLDRVLSTRDLQDMNAIHFRRRKCQRVR
jgi:hypothetical protein